ncbi:A24 family peptidase [Frankia sp. AgB32]|uniref:prepilin peptidase n=1 Tax=Frankia sp. AgB32 TaxID=631119 RepID=UPI00200DA524|nr:A24 family peptidase [Frankia sp. AgB32]MCK9897467.1 A24 family peptidase [Frankia sp. AgB32]
MVEAGLAALIALGVLAVAVPLGPGVVARVPPPPGAAPHRDAPGPRRLRLATVLAVVVVAGALYRHPSWLLAYAYLTVLGVWLAAVDLRVHRLPDHLVLPAYPALAVLFGFAALVDAAPGRLARAGVAAAGSWLAFWVLHRVSRGGLGRGDVKLAGLLGGALGWLGWPSVAGGFCAGVLVGGLCALALLAVGRVGRHDRLPYGPFLLVGAWYAVVRAGVHP